MAQIENTQITPSSFWVSHVWAKIVSSDAVVACVCTYETSDMPGELKFNQNYKTQRIYGSQSRWIRASRSTSTHATIRQTPKPIYDVPSFKQHLAHSISLMIDNDPDAIFILLGDLNWLNTSELQTDLGLVQIVNVPMHNNNILDQFITN